MLNNKNGFVLKYLIIVIIIALIFSGVVAYFAINDNSIISKTIKMDLETSEGEIRDHLLSNINNELLSCSADIEGTATDISTRYNEIMLINFLAGNMNFSGKEYEDNFAVECIEIAKDAMPIVPIKQDVEISDEVKANLVEKGLITDEGKIYTKYRIIPKALSESVDNYGKGIENDVFILQAVHEDETPVTGKDDDVNSSGKYQLVYINKDGKSKILETISLYKTSQS